MSGPPPLPSYANAKPGKPPPLPKDTIPCFKDAFALSGLTPVPDDKKRNIYAGEVQGLRISADYSRRSRTKYYGEIRTRVHTGFRLDLTAPAEVGGRMVLAYASSLNKLTRWLNKKGNLLPVPMPNTLQWLEAWSADPGWAAALLEDAACQADLLVLFPETRVVRNLSLQWYLDRLVIHAVSHEPNLARALPSWTPALAHLARQTLARPRPLREHQPGWMEQHPVQLMCILIFSVLLLAILFPLLLLGIGYLILS